MVKKIVRSLKRIVKPSKFLYRNRFIHQFNKTFIKILLNRKKELIANYKLKYGVNNIRIGHFHFDYFNDQLGLRIFEAYAFRHKIYKTSIGYVVADVHLGISKYSFEDLKPIEDILNSQYKLIILGDLTEWRIPFDNYTLAEKRFLEKVVLGIKKGKVIYIRGNHDNCFLKNYRKDFYIDNDILLHHGDFLLNDIVKPIC